jgi:hypothetical protein
MRNQNTELYLSLKLLNSRFKYQPPLTDSTVIIENSQYEATQITSMLNVWSEYTDESII